MTRKVKLERVVFMRASPHENNTSIHQYTSTVTFSPILRTSRLGGSTTHIYFTTAWDVHMAGVVAAGMPQRFALPRRPFNSKDNSGLCMAWRRISNWQGRPAPYALRLIQHHLQS